MEQIQVNQSTGSKLAQVEYGVWKQPLEVAGKTVAEARAIVNNLWRVPLDANAFKDKAQMDDSYIIQPGDKIEFHRRSGEKGI